MITLDELNSDFHSVSIKDGANQLAIDGAGAVSAVVSATDLDIRNLAFATDKVDVSGSEVSLDATTLAALENVTVSATDLDIRDLAFATDKVDASGSEVSLDATTLAALENVVVSATDLDIRDLAFATDKVDVSGSEVSLDATTLAALENVVVSATDLDIRDLAFATDKVDVSGSTITTQADSYDVWKSTAQSITSTASQVAATALAGRLSITIENLGSKDIFIGASNAVTVANGIKIAAGSSFSELMGASATIWAITASGTADVRIAEFAS